MPQPPPVAQKNNRSSSDLSFDAIGRDLPILPATRSERFLLSDTMRHGRSGVTEIARLRSRLRKVLFEEIQKEAPRVFADLLLLDPRRVHSNTRRWLTTDAWLSYLALFTKSMLPAQLKESIRIAARKSKQYVNWPELIAELDVKVPVKIPIGIPASVMPMTMVVHTTISRDATGNCEDMESKLLARAFQQQRHAMVISSESTKNNPYRRHVAFSTRRLVPTEQEIL